MADTRANLDGQSDKVLTEPRIQTRLALKDAGASQALYLDFDEPAGADRTVNFPDPGADDTAAYLNKAQVFQNKQITTVPAAPDDVANKAYVDSVAGAAVPTATAAPGGGVEGKVTADSDKGLDITAGVMEIKVSTTEGIEFNGSGQLRPKLGTGVQLDGGGALTVPLATAAAGGGTVGRATYDTNHGLDVVAGVARVKVDGAKVTLNGSGELTTVDAGNTTTVSHVAAFAKEISGVAMPGDGTTGTDIDTMDFVDGSTTGVRFDMGVPEDYLSGALDLYVIYRMSTAVGSPNNQIRIASQAKIVDVSTGAIDDTTYPEAASDFTVPDNSTDVVRQIIKTIGAGDFAIGDKLQFYFKRLGADVNDLHTGDWKVLAFEWHYTSGRGGRVSTQAVTWFQDAVGETRPAAGTIGTDIDTEDFPTGADSGHKIVFFVPEEWDGTEAELRIDYAMSAAAADVVRLDTYGEIANVVSGAIDPLASQIFDLTTPNDTDVHRTVVVRSIDPSALHKGDFINLVLARRVAVLSNHAGDFKVISVTMTFGTATVFGGGVAQDHYLGIPTFGNHSGPGVFGDEEFPDFAADFETLTRMHSTVAAGRIDAGWQGRLGTGQSEVRQIRTAVKGTGQYRLRVYVEGSGDTPVYDSGLQSAPGTLTTLSINAVDLSAQPTGQKRFHVVMEAHIDDTETVFAARPFVQQE